MSLEQALKRPLDYEDRGPDQRKAIDEELGLRDWQPDSNDRYEYCRQRGQRGEVSSLEMLPVAWANMRLDSMEKHPYLWVVPDYLGAFNEVYVVHLRALAMHEDQEVSTRRLREALNLTADEHGVPRDKGAWDLTDGLQPQEVNKLLSRLVSARAHFYRLTLQARKDEAAAMQQAMAAALSGSEEKR